MRVVIADDEELARRVVREYLEREPGTEVVAECANGFEAVKAVAEYKPDVLFLDVQMPKLDGFEVPVFASAGAAWCRICSCTRTEIKLEQLPTGEELVVRLNEK